MVNLGRGCPGKRKKSGHPVQPLLYTIHAGNLTISKREVKRKVKRP